MLEEATLSSQNFDVSTSSDITTLKERMVQKVQSVTYRPELFLYLLVEELLLSLDARGILVEHHQQALETATSESNLLQIEYEQLLRFFQHHEDRDAAVAAVFVLARSTKQIPNSNLWDVNTQVSVSARYDSHRLVVRAWLAEPSSKSELVTAIAKSEGGVGPQLERALSEVLQTHVRLHGQSGRALQPFEPAQSGMIRPFLEEKRRLFLRTHDLPTDPFLAAYSQAFQPLELLTQRITYVIHRYLSMTLPQTAGYSPPLVYSFRQATDAELSFFLTTEQLRQLLCESRDPFTREEVCALLMFAFAPGTGLSGYVLQTGHSDLTREPSNPNDLRWDLEKRTATEKATFHLIDKLYAILKGGSAESGNKNVFLLPLFVRRSPTASAADPNRVQLLVECTLPDDESLQLRLRRQLLHLQWEAMPMVESAILAQQSAQLRLESEISRYITAHAWTLGHNFPKFLSKPVVNIADKIELQIDRLRDVLIEYLTDAQQEIQHKSLEQIRDYLAYLRLMATHYSNFFKFFVSSLPGGHAAERIVAPADDRFEPREVANELTRFVRHYRGILADTTRSVRDGERCAAYAAIRLDVRCDFSQSDRRRISYNKALFLELLLNHIGNSIDELARQRGSLIDRYPDRGSIVLSLQLQPVIGRDDGVAFLCVQVIDQGPGMPRDLLKEIRSKIADVLQGTVVQPAQSGLTRKPEHTGSGFLINANILRSFRDGELSLAGCLTLEPTVPNDSAGEGLTVTLNIPVRVSQSD